MIKNSKCIRLDFDSSKMKSFAEDVLTCWLAANRSAKVRGDHMKHFPVCIKPEQRLVLFILLPPPPPLLMTQQDGGEGVTPEQKHHQELMEAICSQLSDAFL